MFNIYCYSQKYYEIKILLTNKYKHNLYINTNKTAKPNARRMFLVAVKMTINNKIRFPINELNKDANNSGMA